MTAQLRADRGPALPALYHGGGGPVPKEDAGSAVLPIGDAAQGIRPHHQAEFSGRGVQQALHGVEGKEKAGAGGVQVKAGNILGQPQLPLERAGGGGHEGICRDGCHDAGSDLLRRDAGFFQRRPGRSGTQRGVGLSPAVAAAVNAGAAGDPRIAGVHYGRKVCIGNGFLRHTTACAFDFDSFHGSSSWTFAPIFLNFR